MKEENFEKIWFKSIRRDKCIEKGLNRSKIPKNEDLSEFKKMLISELPY